MTAPHDILSSIPDFEDPVAAKEWFDETSKHLRAFQWSIEAEERFISMDVHEMAAPRESPFGYYASPPWRRLTLAVLSCDWACYPAPVDQVTFERLVYAMHVFPLGFRVWWTRDQAGRWLPVGYSGWHPISELTFEILEQRGHALRDRAILPQAQLDHGGGFAYLFNVSIISPLRRTRCARQLIQRLGEDLGDRTLRGLAAVTVSPDGIRVVTRFGLEPRGTVNGSDERIYTTRYPNS